MFKWINECWFCKNQTNFPVKNEFHSKNSSLIGQKVDQAIQGVKKHKSAIDMSWTKFKRSTRNQGQEEKTFENKYLEEKFTTLHANWC